MVEILLEDEGHKVALRSHYDPKIIERAKAIPGYRWDKERRMWVWPETAAATVLAAFCEAQVDPRLIELVQMRRRGTEDAQRFAEGEVPDIAFPIRVHPGRTLFAHQRRMAGMALSMPAYAFFAEMRTGKTLATIAAAGRAYLDGRIASMLVVCPTSVMYVWQREFEEWADFPYEIRVLDHDSVAKKRAALSLPWQQGTLHIAVINFESTWRMIESLQSFACGQLVVVDESHRIKDARTRQAKAIHKLGELASWRLILTGTPITQNPLDAFSQYLFLDPTIFGRSFVNFRNRYAVVNGYRVSRWKNMDEFRRKAHSIAFRIRRDECWDVPDEIDETVEVRLSPKTGSIYANVRALSVAELSSGKVTAANILTKLLRLQQIAGGFATTDDGEVVQVGSEKIDITRDLLTDILADHGRKVVVFARFLPEIAALAQALRDAGIPAVAMIGETPIRERADMVHQFAADGGPRVFVAQIATGGLGIDLSRADTTIFLSCDWSLATMQQARARILGSGQMSKKVSYLNIVAKGTVDAKILRALEAKQDLAATIVDTWREVLREE